MLSFLPFIKTKELFKIYKLDNNKRGLTLIELVVSIALLAVIIAAAVSFYYYGARTFSEGENQVEVQRNVGLAADCMIKEIRNTNDLTLVSTPSYKGFTLNGTSFNAVGEGSIRIGLISDVTFSFDSTASGKAMLNLSVTGGKGKQQYTITNNVLLNNIKPSVLQSKGYLTNPATYYKLNVNTLYYKP